MEKAPVLRWLDRSPPQPPPSMTNSHITAAEPGRHEVAPAVQNKTPERRIPQFPRPAMPFLERDRAPPVLP